VSTSPADHHDELVLFADVTGGDPPASPVRQEAFD